MYSGIGSFIEVVEFETEPDRQRPLIDLLVAETERWIRASPGFVQTAFHASLDGQHVVLHARWSSQRALQAFREHDDYEKLIALIRKAHPKSKPHTRGFHVVDTIGPPFAD